MLKLMDKKIITILFPKFLFNHQFKSTPTAEEAHVHFSADFIFVFYMVQDILCITWIVSFRKDCVVSFRKYCVFYHLWCLCDSDVFL